jgi:penicillin-binding protein 1B
MIEELDLLHEPAGQQPPPPPEPRKPGFFERREGRILAASVICLVALGAFVFGYYYMKNARKIDSRLQAGPFSGTINVFTSPRTFAVGDPLTAEELVGRLRRSGYTMAKSNTVGWYNVRRSAVEIFPGRDSYAGGEPGVLEFANGKISRIVSLGDHTERQQFQLEPQLITNISDAREKRRLVHFNEIPPVLVHAVISVEDKHFFNHSGFDLFRIMKAAYVDMKQRRKEQGASTLTMQLARGFWLDPDKNWHRKLQELLITMHLEHKLTKQQIFEYYANQVYMGRRGTFSINGFGEAAHVYFGKDLPQLNTPEAALIAGMIQRPSYYNPYRYPDRARERRNIVLTLMRQNGYLSDAEFRDASATPVHVTPQQPEGLESQYFIDLMNDELQNRMEDERAKKMRFIYTTLDPDLQHAAEDAVRDGMRSVDELLKKKKMKAGVPPDQPQVALIALDPRTGEVKALVGGRNYGISQLNHVTAMRQPGSVFKPFVYAAAMETAVAGGSKIFTPASMLSDNPTTFYFGNKPYQPSNFHQDFMGDVTVRTALAHSLNVATVELAQEVGYNKVVAMARRAGLNEAIKATPAVALGAYETTPYEIAGAYTMFPNGGNRVSPTTISLVRAPGGSILYQHQPETRNVLDPRVNFLMVSLMQDVLRWGTGAGVRSRGFTLPAAGKTGTSRDGWFAGFTSKLLCVVWVGFDDGRELNLEGAKSALPIWAGFMKTAAKFHQYADAEPFRAPSGVTSVKICSDSGQLAGEYCPNVRSDMFINGTQPAVECELHSMQVNYADRVMDPGVTTGDRPAAPVGSGSASTGTVHAAPPVASATTGTRTVAPTAVPAVQKQ